MWQHYQFYIEVMRVLHHPACQKEVEELLDWLTK
jgi:hypothetical protein